LDQVEERPLQATNNNSVMSSDEISSWSNISFVPCYTCQDRRIISSRRNSDFLLFWVKSPNYEQRYDDLETL